MKHFLPEGLIAFVSHGPPAIYSKRMGVSSPKYNSCWQCFLIRSFKCMKCCHVNHSFLPFILLKKNCCNESRLVHDINIHICWLIASDLNRYGQLAAYEWLTDRLEQHLGIMDGYLWIDKLTPFNKSPCLGEPSVTLG